MLLTYCNNMEIKIDYPYTDKFNSNIQYNKGLNYTDSIFIREYRKDPSEYENLILH